MRKSAILVSGAALACIAAPALAQSTANYAACENLAVQRGISMQERRASEAGASPFRQFMISCLAGEVSGTTGAAVAVPATPPTTPAGQRIATQWDKCDALAMQRGVAENERRAAETQSAWRQFMVACLGGKIQ
jgi:hypothetical protein